MTLLDRVCIGALIFAGALAVFVLVGLGDAGMRGLLMRVIALDPGKLTGWAAADIDERAEWSNLEHGILSAKDMVLMLAKAQGIRGGFWESTDWPSFDVIVYEDWVLYRSHADEYVGSDMPYSQQIGQYRLIAWLSDVPIVKQGAERKKQGLKQVRAWRPELARKIDSIAARQHKDGHDGDALLHLWIWTVSNFPNLEEAHMIESLVNNVYKGPATDALQRGFDGWVWGEVRISDFEMRTYSGAGHEDAFVGILQARIQSTLDAMIDEVKYELRPDDTDALDDPIDTLER